MKSLVLYHANCADGFGAAFAAWTVLGDEAEYVAVKYNDIDTHLEYTGRDLYILDFSFPREAMEHMFANARRVIWLDHHKTAFETWTGGYCKGGIYKATPQGDGDPLVHHVMLDDNKSGALLAWEYFHPSEEIPLLFQHLDDYDRWQFKLPGTKELNKAMWSYTPWSFEKWAELFQADHTGYPMLKAEGAAILRAHDRNVQSVVEGAARDCRIIHDAESSVANGAPGLIANCPSHLTSDVGHELANQSGTYGLCWTLKKDGMIASCSLRSSGDYDVSAIAKSFSGGGHRNAAGFEVPIETLLSWLS